MVIENPENTRIMTILLELCGLFNNLGNTVYLIGSVCHFIPWYKYNQTEMPTFINIPSALMKISIYVGM